MNAVGESKNLLSYDGLALERTWFRLSQVARGALCALAASAVFAGSARADIAQQPVKLGQAERLCDDPGFSAPVGRQIRAEQCLLNGARSNALSTDPLLGESATQKIRDEINCDNFSHTPCLDEATLETLTHQEWVHEALKDLPPIFPNKGEILAYGCGEEGTAQAIFSGWMQSPEHRPIIENEDYTIDGISRLWVAKAPFNLAPLCVGEPTAEWAVHFEGPQVTGS